MDCTHVIYIEIDTYDNLTYFMLSILVKVEIVCASYLQGLLLQFILINQRN